MSKLMYLGPSRPFGLPLNTRAVLAGKPEEVFPEIKPYLLEHPGLAKLFVPLPDIPRARAQLGLEGSALSTLYKNIKAASEAGGK